MPTSLPEWEDKCMAKIKGYMEAAQTEMERDMQEEKDIDEMNEEQERERERQGEREYRRRIEEYEKKRRGKER